MDQALVQSVDVHAGLDNTLVTLRSKLSPGVAVHRDYAADLPPIEAHGSELNQVWTNLIDNAIDAMNGSGEITLRARRDDGWAVVEVDAQARPVPAGDQRPRHLRRRRRAPGRSPPRSVRRGRRRHRREPHSRVSEDGVAGHCLSQRGGPLL
jgi:signal transduction histidine kinase